MSIGKCLRKMLYFPRLFLIIPAFVILSPSLSQSYELFIGTGKVGTFSHFAGKAVCRTIHKFDNNLTCRPVPSETPTDSLTNVLGGSLDMALVNSKMIYEAFQQAGSFQYITLEYDQLRLLMPLYRTPICLLVRQDAKITIFADLAGKRVNGGAPFSLQNIVFQEIMAVEGWRKNSFSLFQNLSAANEQDFIALHGGSVQAMLHIGMHPDEKLERSLANGSTDIVGVSGQAVRRLIDSNSGFLSQSIPSGTYPGQSRDIDTLSLETLLITSADTDNETVTLILDAIFAAKDQLQSTHPSFLQEKTDVETLNDSYLHPHPEAILFFQANQNRL